MTQPSLLGNAALVIWGDVKSGDIEEAALNDWWTNEHLPERLSLPGFLRARRYSFRDDSADRSYYLTLYETADLAALTSPEYMEKLNSPTPKTSRHVPTLATMKRAACEVVYSQQRAEFGSKLTVSGATTWLMEFTLPDEESVAQIHTVLKQRVPEWLENDVSLMSCSLLKENAEATAPGSSSQSYLNANLESDGRTTGIRCVLLLECSRSAAQVMASNGLKIEEQVFATVHSREGVQAPVSRIYSFLAGVSS